MNKSIAALTLLALAGYSAERPTTFEKPFDPNAPELGCPTLPSEFDISITGKEGIDFWSCYAINNKTGKQAFHVYVGNHPDVPDNLRYTGTTSTVHGSLSWFRPPMAVKSSPWDPKPWITFIPTGDLRMSVMVVTFTATPQDLPRIADTIAQLRQ
ncbi:hypothetical protein [Luteimonas panaciterrae]|uniref:hypothetical protein n=1 Tax=Luteimonas panaciterrae TaxID=363885 RepID=UPI001CFAFE65|nr:hypothetical protein [Luteimonas panaciterrae]